MRVVVLGFQEVRVVGREHGEPEVLPEAEDLLVETALIAGLVRLHLEVVAVLEELGVPGGDRLGLVVVVLEEMARDLPCHAGARDDQPFMVARQELTVDARFAVEPFGVGEGGELDEVAVPGEVPRQEDEMVVVLLPLLGAALEAAVPGGHIGLHPEDRLDPRLLGLLLERPGGVQVAMVRDREGGLLELLGPGDQVVDPVRPIQQGVFGVAVQVHEGHGRRRIAPRPPPRDLPLYGCEPGAPAALAMGTDRARGGRRGGARGGGHPIRVVRDPGGVGGGADPLAAGADRGLGRRSYP